MFYARSSAGGRWLMGLMGTGAAMAIVVTVILQVPNVRAKALEAQCKQNTHSIQLALERFSVDSPRNTYPLWLCGGSAAAVSEGYLDTQLAGDVLISEGYMPYYPKNPFCAADRRVASQLRQMQELVGDPFRPRTDRVRQAPAWRFGADYTLMGCVSVEPIVGDSREHNREIDNLAGMRIPSSVRYPYASERLDRDTGHWLQGQFRYHPRCSEPDGISLAGNSGHTGNPGRDAANYQATGYTLWGFGSVRFMGSRNYR